MNGLGLIADGLLIVLLGAALISVYRLNQRLGVMREGREGLEKLAGDLAKQTGVATEGLTALRSTAETLARDLDGRSDRGRQVMAELQKATDDIRLLIGRADKSAERLESAIAKVRAHEAAQASMERPPASDSDRQSSDRQASDRPAERVSPEKAALLSQLSGIR
jgi:hypothetical protein